MRRHPMVTIVNEIWITLDRGESVLAKVVEVLKQRTLGSHITAIGVRIERPVPQAVGRRRPSLSPPREEPQDG